MLKTLCQQGKIEWTSHAIQRLIKRGLTRQEVKDAILTGEIIEDYPNDYPFPSCLILGKNNIHVVCGIGDDNLWIITAYHPTPDKWKSDFKTRR